MWFAKFLSRFVPEPDIVFVLEADTDLIWRRKPELSQNEIDRQRAAYQQLRFRHSRVVTIKTGVDLEESIGEASQAVASYMKDRFDRRLGGWLTPSRVELGMPS
jgi:thymidylate kinase